MIFFGDDPDYQEFPGSSKNKIKQQNGDFRDFDP